MTVTSSIILPSFAALYGTVTKTRLALYQRGFLKPAKLDAQVISVGNLTVGGTGKTPLVEYVARRVAANGRRVCILTRGYGRQNPRQRVLVSDGVRVLATETEAGDEPLLLAKKLEGVAAVISDADRIAAGRWAISNLHSEVFILDDGFQHLQLARDLNILAVDAGNPWGNGRLLPVGLLREPIKGLRRADCIVLTRADQAEDVEELQRKIRSINGRCTSQLSEGDRHRQAGSLSYKKNSPVFTSRMRGRGFMRLDSSEVITKVPGAAAAFSAIGNPGSFVRQLKAEGLEPVSVLSFRDHHRYTPGDIDEIVHQAKTAGADCLVTTSKDAVKLATLSIPLPCYVLDIEIEIDDADQFDQMVRLSIQ